MSDQNDVQATAEVLASISKELSDFLVGFAKIRIEKRREGEEEIQTTDASLAGFGTLISVDGHHAVLTAAHVLGDLPKAGEAGLILPSRFTSHLQTLSIEMNYTQRIRVGSDSGKPDGPDLAALVLPPHDVETIKATKIFYNVSSRRDRMLSDPPPTDAGTWMLSGAGAEPRTDAPDEPEADSAGMSGAGSVEREFDAGDFDYVDFAARSEQSYAVVSGAGLWQVFLEKDRRGTVRAAEKLLRGVALHQLGHEEQINRVRCHGRKSIYGRAIDKMRSVLS